MNPEIAIIVPCHNEFNRLPKTTFEKFLAQHPATHICFVDDASTDSTMSLLEDLKTRYTHQVSLLYNAKNLGKAGAVQKGVLYCSQQQIAPVLAYLDADLATSLTECHSYLYWLSETTSFVFASRILKIGSVVERRFSRFVFGRIIATFISNILDIKVYDTQCGCKVFKTELSHILFEKPFISKWLFDVELFSRMLCYYGKEKGLKKMEEIPVKKWIDVGESKVKLSYFFRLWYDLFLIRKEHRKAMTS